MIFTTDENTIADNRRRGIGFKSGLILPYQRPVPGVQTVHGVIEIADYQ